MIYLTLKNVRSVHSERDVLKKGQKNKIYSVAMESEEHLDQQTFQEKAEFKSLARERYNIEAENSELKTNMGKIKHWLRDSLVFKFKEKRRY
ncbi:hypothetical protein U0X36_10905 [Bacillus thuringiensis]|uniref:hypothetical protein n=1 Tax=Bacillus thuringiensis TaxID=1428 RepID=UPI000E51A865|nr:hypothetical protein [Bacillus thuringiensis]MDZ3953403.1 hypothetical protein [Bacillus thuringiensis]